MTATPNASEQSPLALMCGGGSLPLAVADHVSARGRRVILFPLVGAAEPESFGQHKQHWLYMGQVGKFLKLARAEGCRDLVFIGSLTRPSVWKVRPDFHVLSALPRVYAAFRGGDNHLLTSIGGWMEEHGFRLLGAHEVAPEILMPEGQLGRVAVNEAARADIALGLDYLHTAGRFDIGQAVVVADKHIIAVEAAEGTDAMLARIAELRRNGRIHAASGKGVLIKAAKPNQDHRFDLPSIGPRTVECVAAAGLAGMAVTAGQAIVAEPEQLVLAADRAGIFVAGVKP
ncbi:MAG: UDP-2,3-diacylglucosamine diphosphatase LpxI [Pseudolabrys sp.]|nr:UDP-2,3-diacylglucosamine diphosphatase LpxI [Pseudolabrys sp.]